MVLKEINRRIPSQKSLISLKSSCQNLKANFKFLDFTLIDEQTNKESIELSENMIQEIQKLENSIS